MINRREFVGITLGAGAALALTPELLFAQTGTLMQRAVPSSGEMLPVVSFAPRSLGGAAMSSQPMDVAAIKAVLKAYLDNGIRTSAGRHLLKELEEYLREDTALRSLLLWLGAGKDAWGAERAGRGLLRGVD